MPRGRQPSRDASRSSDGSPRRSPSSSRRRAKSSAAVLARAKVRLGRDLPQGAIEVAAPARMAAIEGFCGLTDDLGAVTASLLNDVVALLVRPDVVGQGNPAPVRSLVDDA